MRLCYRSMTRARHVARRMHTIFPALSLKAAQNWTARMMDYRDWHEMERFTLSYSGEETPDIILHLTPEGIGNPEDLTALFERRRGQEEVLRKLAGEDVVDMPSMFFAVDPNRGGFPFKKLGPLGSDGSPFFRGLAYDLYDDDGEGTPGRGSGFRAQVGGADHAPRVHLGLPAGKSEPDFYDRLFANMQRAALPYRGYDRDARAVLAMEGFGKSVLSVDEDLVDEGAAPEDLDPRYAEQRRTMRYFMMDGDEPQGYSVVSTMFSASENAKSLDVEIDIVEAWCRYDNDLFTEGWVMAIAGSISGALSRAFWLRVGNPDKEIRVSVISESESQLTWQLAKGVSAALPALLDASEGSGLGDASFNVSICP